MLVLLQYVLAIVQILAHFVVLSKPGYLQLDLLYLENASIIHIPLTGQLAGELREQPISNVRVGVLCLGGGVMRLRGPTFVNTTVWNTTFMII